LDRLGQLAQVEAQLAQLVLLEPELMELLGLQEYLD
jgi:hypothetical protein